MGKAKFNRKFNGKNYTLQLSYGKKGKANDVAKIQRMKGWNVRVTKEKTKSGKGYIYPLWVRRKNR